jgi:diguanylate cyclase
MKKWVFMFLPPALLAVGTLIWLANFDFYDMKSHSKIFVYCIIAQLLLSLYCGMTIHKLYRQANTDSLTGICNRRCFFSKTHAIFKMKLPVSLMMIDIDNFKRINDTFGHLAGDEALRQIAEILKNNTRKKDIVARMGGEEFAVVLPQTSYENALKIAERIKKIIEAKTFIFNTVNGRMTISIGIATTNIPVHVDSLLSYADKALPCLPMRSTTPR